MKKFGLGHKEYVCISKHDMQGTFLLFLACCCFLSGTLACTDDQGEVNRQATAAVQPAQFVSQSELIAELSHEQIRSYLQYYSPVIFKQANEYDDHHKGHDWITNFNYDQDNYLANNKENWSDELKKYVNQGEHPDWQIRPTLFSAAILFYDHSLQTNSIILLYHVYHAKQRYEIHDWERIEIRIDNVHGGPGSGEEINYVVITRHSLHNAREYPDPDLNFMTTSAGKHVMIWQADWDFNPLNPSQGELHFVEESWSDIMELNRNNATAKVDINNEGKSRFHYIFVDQSDTGATNFWNAQAIQTDNASSLASGKDQYSGVPMSEVKRITYELQDLADIIPSHLDPANWKDDLSVNMVTPVTGENGTTEVPSGITTFHYTARDTQDPDEDRKGYIRKHWFWGVYIYGTEGDNFYSELGTEPWYQHLYFAHNGTRGDGSVEDELENRGIFLGKGEYADWNTSDGGFDGRWVQLFPD
ncbi:MAG: hypothetical protein ABFC30_03485 [Proteiniphilum sp.]